MSFFSLHSNTEQNCTRNLSPAWPVSTVPNGHTDSANEWMINTLPGVSLGSSRSGVSIPFVVNFPSDQILFWPRHQGLFPCSCSDQEKNSVNKIKLHRQTGDEQLLWQHTHTHKTVSPNTHSFSSGSRSYIRDAIDAGRAWSWKGWDWQTEKTQVNLGDPYCVSWPHDIYTVYNFLENWDSCHKRNLIGRKVEEEQ